MMQSLKAFFVRGVARSTVSICEIMGNTVGISPCFYFAFYSTSLNNGVRRVLTQQVYGRDSIRVVCTKN